MSEDTRARLNELTDHLTGMADSLDDHVTHEDVYRLLMEALDLSRQRDAALTEVLKLHAIEDGKGIFYGDCRACAYPHPCPTVTRITEKLGGGDRG